MAEGLDLPGAGPRVFAVPPGVPVAEALAAGLRARLDPERPEVLGRLTLLLDTRRSGRGVIEALEAGAPACFLPRVLSLSDMGTDAFADAAALDALPPAVDPLRRWLTLTRLVARWLAADPARGPEAAAPALGRALAGLLDTLHREGLTLDALDAAVPVELARHWEGTRTFLHLLRDLWPAILARDEGGALDPEARRRAVVQATLAAWSRGADPGPVLAAGSPGAAASSAAVMAAVARLPAGAVVLPGFDPAFAADIWPDIGPEHPWAGHRALLDSLGVDPASVPLWSRETGLAPRRHLVLQALRPAPVTDRWLEDRPTLAAEAAAATAGLSLIEAPDPRREATAIALALRQALETPGTRAALVTPDRGLARRVAAALLRWGIVADDSGGRPLSLTPPGVLLRLVAEVAFGPFDPVALLALLRHPLLAAGPERGAHLRAVRRFEMKCLRGRPEVASLAAARAAVAARAGLEPVTAVLDTLAALAAAAPGPLEVLVAGHRAAAEALCGPGLWAQAAGEAADSTTAGLAGVATVYGDCAGPAYPALFATALDGVGVTEEAFRPDPRVAIWGALEARMQAADLLVLGGLNEGTWPAQPPPDPWMSRPMRKAAGLPPPEALIGLGALDFAQAACAPRVILTRSMKEGGSPATPSRWLARLTTLLAGTAPDALAAMRARGSTFLGLVDPLEQPSADVEPEPRPCPAPPVAARPARLSATEIETLIRDPYAIYARHVLGLKALPALGIDADARLRGEVLHKALELFCRRTADGWPGNPAAILRESLDAAMAAAPLPASLRRLWRARLDRLAPRFLDEEAARRAGAQPLAFERKGRLAKGGFTLTAKADRIDRTADGRLAVYDYKTGHIPTDREIEAFAKQMPLMAAIAEAGGFEEVAAAPVALLAHVSLGGGAGAGGAVPLDGEPAALAEAAWTGLMKLVEAFRDPALGYLARARPRTLRHAGDYDHLARLGEWEAGDD